ncbi:phage distal tail protein [Actinopolyspora halophila]|uniref:phage distal tail protein n=1 Tax=Actinopolyspora halophila TaxID=1850 RepID=UPI00036E563B|nr:phage tail domain-containing protein [Actinopolyspora halophila]
MAIAFRSSSQVAADEQETITVTKPADLAQDDTLVALCFATGDPMGIQAPSGWAQQGGLGQTEDAVQGKVFTRLAEPSEPAEYEFSVAPDASALVIVGAFSGVSAANPLVLVQWGGTTVSTTTHVAPAVSPGVANTMLVTGWAAGSGASSYDTASGMTEFADVASSAPAASAAYQLVTGTGETGSRTATYGDSAAYLSVSLVLRPSAPGVAAEEGIFWISADGSQTELAVEWDTDGRFVPPVHFEEEAIPGYPGTRLRAVRHEARDVQIPIWLVATSEGELRHNIRSLARQLDPTRGEGTLRVVAPSGDQRDLRCRYQAGLEVSESLGDTSGPFVQRATLVFRAHDPYWYDANMIVQEFTQGELAAFFPIFPIRLTASEVFASVTVNNAGDVQAWPLWEITGPGENIALVNSSSGKRLELSTTLAEGELITIDTRLNRKTVVHSDGTNLFPDLTLASSLFPLWPGDNALQIQMTGISAASKVLLTFHPRFLTA